MIPKLMHQIWVGPLAPPLKWMDTWRDAHPDWGYRLWNNLDLVAGWERWKNIHHMDHFSRLKRWDGVADLMRYEILSSFGGVVIAADSECLHPIDELFDDQADLYAIDLSSYGDIRKPADQGAACPLYAATQGHWFPALLVDKLSRAKMTRSPSRSTGNRLMQRMLKRHDPEIVRWPMHYFIPEHFNGWRYAGPDRVYAKHYWGSTRGTYSEGI